MFRNYLKIAFRSLAKNSVYSIINLAGLAVGLACSILILLWVADELSFNKFHTNANQIHQLWINATYDGQVNSFNSAPIPAKDELKTRDSRIKNTVLADWGANHLLVVGDKRISNAGHIVSEEFLDIFHFPIVKGQPEIALDEPNSVVLTEATATALFGNSDPIGKIISLDNKYEVKVTGVLKNVPSNSSFQFNFLIPFSLVRNEGYIQEADGDWGDYSWLVYVELQPGVPKEEVEKVIKNLLAEKGQTDMPREFFLHPLLRWRLHSTFENGKEAGGMNDYVQGFSIIAIFIIAMACINFMNLATARSESRAREVGIRKSIGSRRKELIFQFIGESVIIAALSFVIALVLVELSLPLYNNLVKKTLFIEYTSIEFWLYSLAIILVTGIFSGSYPAFYLSSFEPAKVLKGKMQIGKNATPRQILVVLQFVFATGLVIGTLVISQQIQFTKLRSLGYDQENLLTVLTNEQIAKNYSVIKQELLNSGAVVSVTKSNSPVTEIFANNFLDWEGKPAELKVLFSNVATEYDYTKTLGIKILEGRDFSEDFKSDTASVLVNKTAAEVMGLKETVGTQVTYWGERKATIIGVIDDVLMGSPNGQIMPSFVVFQPEWVNAVTIRLEKTDDIQTSIKKVESIFKKLDPSHPFEYAFVDDLFAKKFAGITMVNNIANLFAFLAIFITSLGLFGLAAFTAEQRKKEIGIRKVMGASVSGLVAMIAKEFSWLVVIGFAVAAPLSWWSFNNYLERYSYRIDFPFWVIVFSGIAFLIFTLLIVSTQALKAAMGNPVDSLRSE
jgi:putative ABC transport system permease protein